MVKSFLSVSTFLSLISTSAWAHKMGDANWCLDYTDTHQECFYDNSETCENTLKSVLLFNRKHSGLKSFADKKDGTKTVLLCSPNPTRQHDTQHQGASKKDNDSWNPKTGW